MKWSRSFFQVITAASQGPPAPERMRTRRRKEATAAAWDPWELGDQPAPSITRMDLSKKWKKSGNYVSHRSDDEVIF